MKKLVFIYLLFPCFCFGQEKDSLVKVDGRAVKNNQFNVDLTLYPSIAYSGRISKKWFLGGGIGYGTPAFAIVEPANARTSGMAEFLPAEIFGRYVINKYMSVDAGFRAAILYYLVEGDEGGGAVLGCYLNPMIGFRYFKVGFRLVFGQYYHYSSNWGLYTTPIIFRGIIPF